MLSFLLSFSQYLKANGFDVSFMYVIVYEYIITVEELLFSNENLMTKLRKKITYHAQRFLIDTLDFNALF
jgi:hypothetical protein